MTLVERKRGWCASAGDVEETLRVVAVLAEHAAVEDRRQRARATRRSVWEKTAVMLPAAKSPWRRTRASAKQHSSSKNAVGDE
mmetsp:Transcript_3383/g.7294  ORF Transcript_3383/g.7294 Transcript_3383/m.7294 type:complete len:83 (+) Transcript_3383:639-887(+)